jgi:hypothetical protein
MPPLLPAPDALPPTTQSSRYQASVRTVNGADHPDLVTTSHLPGGHGGTLAKQLRRRHERTGGDCGGGGGELGRATATALAAGGRSVVAVDRNERGLLGLPSGIRREVADTTDPAVAAKLIDRIAAEHDP